MKKRRIRYIVVGSGNECPTCGKVMQRRKHKERPTKSYFFTEWDYCSDCKRVQHYEEFKSTQWQEDEQRDNFFRSL